jgi:hypothetical protein
MSSKLSEAQDAFFQAFAAMPRSKRTLFANYAFGAAAAPLESASETESIELAAHELLALSDAIHEET